MNLFRSLIVIAALGALFFTLPADALSKGFTLYVSTKGNDSWSGKIPAVNKTKTDGPLLSLIRARDLIREKRKSGNLPDGPVIVNISRGIYRITEGLELTSEDSGTQENPVIWRAQPGEEVRFIGGARLTDWHPVTDAAVLERLDPEARKNVLQTDLKSAGVTDYGTPTPASGTQAQLVFNNKYMTLARYPNEGEWEHIADIPTGGTLYKTEYDNHYGRWSYKGDRPSRWKDVSDLWVHGYWVYDWADQFQRVQKLDLQKKEVWPEPPMHIYGYRRGQRFYYLNIIEELNSPGEFFIDRTNGIMYFWPPASAKKAEILFPQLKKPVFNLTETKYINIRGITFECTHGQAVSIVNGTDNEIAGCAFRTIGGDEAVRLNGTGNGIRSSDIYEIAGLGVRMEGGDKKTLTPGKNYAVNNDIHHTGRVYRTNHGAFVIEGVGNRIANCYIHDLPHHSIAYGGNDHIIEYCDFTRIAQETGDVGVIYTMADWTNMGEEIRYNYFHNVHGPGNLGCFTIYPDLPCGGIHLHHNIFYDVDQVFHTNSGRGMVIENNLFLKCIRGMSFGMWTQDYMFKEGGPWRMVENLKAVNYDQPPYVTRYPTLKNLADDFAKGVEKIQEVEKPKDNIIRRNVSSGNWFARVDPNTTLDQVKVENNLIADDIAFSGSADGNGVSKDFRNGDADTAAEFGKRGNILIKGGLSVGKDYDLSKTQARKIGFETIPFNKIGLYIDQYRKKLNMDPAPPTIEPDSRAFLKELTFKITQTPQTGRAKVVVRYTLDGSEPTVKSIAYTKSVKITQNARIRAAVFAGNGSGALKSDSVAANYRFISLKAGSAYVSDLPEEDLFCYTSCWKKDTNHLGAPLKLNGIEYPKGILLHPDKAKDGNYGHVTYELTGELRKAKHFTAVVGIEDAMSMYNRGSAAFIVEAHRNGKWEKVFESSVIKFGDQSQKVSADISGSDKIRLTSTDGGDGIECDHAVWANALLK